MKIFERCSSLPRLHFHEPGLQASCESCDARNERERERGREKETSVSEPKCRYPRKNSCRHQTSLTAPLAKLRLPRCPAAAKPRASKLLQALETPRMPCSSCTLGLHPAPVEPPPGPGSQPPGCPARAVTVLSGCTQPARNPPDAPSARAVRSGCTQQLAPEQNHQETLRARATPCVVLTQGKHSPSTASEPTSSTNVASGPGLGTLGVLRGRIAV